MSMLCPFSPETPADVRPDITPAQRTAVRWFEAPIDEDQALVNRIAWDRFNTRWLNVAAWGGVFALLFCAAFVGAAAWSMAIASYLALASSVAAGVMTIPGCMVQIGRVEQTNFQPLPEQQRGEFDWLLERTPTGQPLRAYLALHPRTPYVGELLALQRAHREAGSPQTRLLPGEAYRAI